MKSSDSPYLKVKASSIALASVLQKPMQMRDQMKLVKSKSSEALTQLSIFKKPRVDLIGSIPSMKSDIVYNGVGGTSKVLQSDLKESNSFGLSLPSTSKSTNIFKKRNISAAALRK